MNKLLYNKIISVTIKNEEEFIKDFGNNWRHIIRYGWGSGMDYLFSKRLTLIFSVYRDGITEYHLLDGSCFTITDEMISSFQYKNSFICILDKLEDVC